MIPLGDRGTVVATVHFPGIVTVAPMITNVFIEPPSHTCPRSEKKTDMKKNAFPKNTQDFLASKFPSILGLLDVQIIWAIVERLDLLDVAQRHII